MATAESFGMYLINDLLPEEYRLEGAVTKGTLQKKMINLAKADQKKYVEIIQQLKKLGDMVATLEGISVGLDDIAPEYEKRDPVMRSAMKDIKNATTDEARRKIVVDTEEKLLAVAKTHAGDMGLMARSGGRGNIAQLMKTVASPVASKGPDGKPVPWLIAHSYAEGLRPGEAWIANDEARRGAIESTGSVVEPGAAAKVIMNNMQDLVIVKEDCGTRNGIMLDADSVDIVDRFLAEPTAGVDTKTPITGGALNTLKKLGRPVKVRSALTCDVPQGVCQRCIGLSANGQVHGIGTNVGSMSAQAISEPLTQMVLNAKHAVRTVSGQKKGLSGLAGFQVLTEVPASFNMRANLAEVDGKVDHIDKAPQGGHYVYVSGKQHYSPPGMDLLVKAGDTVEAGDAMDNGVPMPNEVVKYKGIGLGRDYLAHSVQEVFRNTGGDIDRRHTELLARNAVQYVKIEEDPSGTFIEGDTVQISRLLPVIQRFREKKPLAFAQNATLAESVMQYSVGTRLTPSVIGKLQAAGVKEVQIAKGGPKYRAIMKSIVQNPTLDDDWMSRLGHRYLKRSLLIGAQVGDTSRLDSTNPITAYAHGATFGIGQDGKYGSAYDIDHGYFVEDLDATHEADEEIKEASFWRGAKRVLFGTGSHLTEAPANPTLAKAWNRMQGASMGGNRVVAPSGAVDIGASNAERIQNWLHGAGRKDINFFDGNGAFSDQGYRQYQAFENNLSLRGGMDANQVVGKNPDGSPRALRDVFSASGLDISQDDLDRFSEQRGGVASRLARPVKDLITGEAPLRTLTQRYNQGGVFGRGGMLFGGLSINPDLARQVKNIRNTAPDQRTGTQYQNLAMAGGVEVLDKSLGIGLPGYMAYTAATRAQPIDTPEEAEAAALRGAHVPSRTESVLRAAMEPLAYSALGPVGMLGTSIVPGVLDRLSGAARRFDPIARRADQQTRALHESVARQIMAERGIDPNDKEMRDKIIEGIEERASNLSPQQQP